LAKWTAPWEKVSAYYYPNKEDLTVARRQYGLSSVDECRNWVFGQAATAGDPSWPEETTNAAWG
jgi:hypothetical protein